jgi:Mn-dependent DtxR family transcriptional regulator
MKIQESAENYLEVILVIKERQKRVRAIDIVNELGFSKPSVSVAMKQLEKNNYIRRDTSGYITLEEKGQKIAEEIYERHTLLTKLLIYMGVPEETAKTDACKIEHSLSPETFAAIKNYYQSLC